MARLFSTLLLSRVVVAGGGGPAGQRPPQEPDLGLQPSALKPTTSAGRCRVTSTTAHTLCFLALAMPCHTFVLEALKGSMGCKHYARMLGLSRGYPYILYLSLSKWDAAPFVPFFHKATFGRKIRWQIAVVPPRICHCSCFSVACQVAVQNLRAAHASISARAEVRRFRSEREKFRLSSRGHFSTAGPIAT